MAGCVIVHIMFAFYVNINIVSNLLPHGQIILDMQQDSSHVSNVGCCTSSYLLYKYCSV